ncbi:hypothetical protein [Ascidiaceihabitans sp.]|uniref:hypothetical protein n=1 Tax=Ascidiaceihabitans sp. TaxID=1872644 RepID=UPI00329967CC
MIAGLLFAGYLAVMGLFLSVIGPRFAGWLVSARSCEAAKEQTASVISGVNLALFALVSLGFGGIGKAVFGSEYFTDGQFLFGAGLFVIGAVITALALKRIIPSMMNEKADL